MNNTKSEDTIALNARVLPDIMLMVSAAKKATGKSKQFLISDAIRSKYSRYLETAPEQQANGKRK